MAVERMNSSREDRSPWLIAYSKLKFFRCLLRLIKRKKKCTHSKKCNNHYEDSRADMKDDPPTKFNSNPGCIEEIGHTKPINCFEKGDRDGDKVEEEIVDSQITRLEVRQAVKHIHFGCADSKFKAALQIHRIAKQDFRMKKSLAILGVIPPLVTMLDSSIRGHQCRALQALIELSNGNYTNKALLVEAGIVEKLANLIPKSDREIQEQIAIALLAISALDKSKSIIGSSSTLPALISILKSGTEQGRLASLAALYNLSTCLDNVDAIVRVGAMQPLLNMIESSETAERALAILSNLMVTEEGRKTMDNVTKMPKCLIDKLGSENSAKCQERAAYVLMVLAHRSLNQRQAMMQAGIVPVLLEMALLGTTLAQKRALRILRYLRGDRDAATLAVSGPLLGVLMWSQNGGVSSPNNINITEMKEQKRVVKTMVQKSLHLNMDRIIKRANVPSTSVDSSTKLKALINSSSSKSLPY
eukprot:Gb_41829 [translate_table: standard]